MVLSGVLFCISMKGENLDMMAFSVGIAIIAVILNIPYLLRDGDNKKLTSGFFAFWLTQWRTTFLVLILIVLIGTFAAIRIPKESSPDVSFGVIVITTVYP